MKYLMIFTLLSGTFLSVWGQQTEIPIQQNNPWLKTTKEKLTGQPQCMTEVQREIIFRDLESFKDVITKGYDNGKPIISSQFPLFAAIVKGWVRGYKYLELDTDLAQAWFVKIVRLFNEMYKYSREMDVAEAKKDTKAFEAAKVKYNKAIDMYIELLKKPERTPRKRREALEVEKVKEFKAYNEYLRKLERESRRAEK
jgi:hypothetical protein